MSPGPISKGILSIVFLFTLGAGVGGKNLLKNGDFEKFNGDEPEGWTTTNIPKTLSVVSPSTKIHGGKNAVKCEVKAFYGSPLAGMITQKKIPVTGTNITVSGHYALTSVGKDVGFITFDFQDKEGSNVRNCEQYLAKSTVEYVPFTMSGVAPANAAFLEIRISLLAGEGSQRLHEGSFLLLDDLELTAVSPESQTIVQ